MAEISEQPLWPEGAPASCGGIQFILVQALEGRGEVISGGKKCVYIFIYIYFKYIFIFLVKLCFKILGL